MKRMRRVKILATLGPASQEEKVIEELARAGADIFRINMSHSSHEMLARLVGYIRAVEVRLGHPIGVLVPVLLQSGRVHRDLWMHEVWGPSIDLPQP